MIDINIKRTALSPGFWSLRIPRSWSAQSGDNFLSVHLPILGKDLTAVFSANYYRFLPDCDEFLLIIGEHLTYALSSDCAEDSTELPGSELLRLVGSAPVPPSAVVPPDTFLQTVADVQIEGRFTPLKHQLAAAWHKVSNSRAFDLSTMRTGKTGSVMLALAYLFRTGQVGRTLILAPLSCVRPVWVGALCATLPGFRVLPVIGSKANKIKTLSAGAEIFVTNYESIGLLFDRWEVWRPDCVVIDECTHYASAGSQRTKALRTLLSNVAPRYVWGLTGTPGHDPIKAFAMSKTVNPVAVNVNSQTAWRDLTQYRWGPQSWQWKNRDSAPAMIKKALSPAILFRKEDIFDLPPVVHIRREAELSNEQHKVMSQLNTTMQAMCKDGATVTAQQKSSLVHKILQVAVGTVRNDSVGEVTELDCKNRWAVLDELLHESQSGKVVVFCAYTAPLRRLCAELRRRGWSCGMVDGSVSESRRTDLFRRFQTVPAGTAEDAGGCDVLVAHPRTTAFGVELGAADLMVFDGPPLSGDFVYGQAVERLSSLKQTGSQVTIACLGSCDAEWKLFTALAEGLSASQAVAKLFDDRAEL